MAAAEIKMIETSVALMPELVDDIGVEGLKHFSKKEAAKALAKKACLELGDDVMKEGGKVVAGVLDDIGVEGLKHLSKKEVATILAKRGCLEWGDDVMIEGGKVVAKQNSKTVGYFLEPLLENPAASAWVLTASIETASFVWASKDVIVELYNGAITGGDCAKQIGKNAVSSVLSGGGSLLGSSIGQVMIPVPVAGAVVGGVVGNLLAKFTAKGIFS